MAADSKGKGKDKDKKDKKPAPQAQGKDKQKAGGGPPVKPAKPKKEKVAAEVAAPVEAPKAVPPKPKVPSDPRMKYIKKFKSRFLPRGPLRDRHKVLLTRWDSGDDHGGVTEEELKSLLEDWRAARAKPSRAVKV
ncbi:MAG: hypothetical protein NVSMB14_03630 [Isosphaeraceae bacterium]